MRAALLALLLATGCAAGVVVRPDGTRISGLAFGAASLECCETGGAIAPSTGEKDGSLHNQCARMTGGDLSASAAQVVKGAIDGLVAYLSMGASTVVSTP
jgi:hypothetical protein